MLAPNGARRGKDDHVTLPVFIPETVSTAKACYQAGADALHLHGAWYRILTEDNQKIDALKSPAGKKDYHTIGACYEVLQYSLKKQEPANVLTGSE